MDRDEGDIDVLSLENDTGTPDGHFADPAGAKSAADDDTLRIAPGLQLKIAADDQREFLGKVFDRTLNHTGGFRVTFSKQRVERLLAEIFAGFFAKRIFAVLAQRLAPVLEDFPKRALGYPVAEESLVVLGFEIVTIDLDRGQARAAVDRQIGQSRRLVGHAARPPPNSANGETTGKFHGRCSAGGVIRTRAPRG